MSPTGRGPSLVPAPARGPSCTAGLCSQALSTHKKTAKLQLLTPAVQMGHLACPTGLGAVLLW